MIKHGLVASSAAVYLKKANDLLEFQAGENEQEQIDRRSLVSEGHLVDIVSREKTPL